MKVAVSLRNSGNTPASNVKFDWYIATDKDGEIMDPESFYLAEFKENFFPATIGPKEGGEDFGVYQPDISGATEFVTLNVVVQYEGTTQLATGKYKKYWSVTKSKYKYISRDQNENVTSLIRVSNFTNWDRNRESDPPDVKSD